MHGMTHTPEYRAFSAAKYRCNNPCVPGYKDYGGRGVRFLFASFEEFYAELGPRPGAGYSVDRINNDGNYEPGNVRWATWSQQIRNQRRRHSMGGLYRKRRSPFWYYTLTVNGTRLRGSTKQAVKSKAQDVLDELRLTPRLTQRGHTLGTLGELL